MKLGIYVAALMLLLSINAFAAGAELSSSCYAPMAPIPTKSEKIKVQGTNLDKLMPIASVSKLITSYWALKKNGPNHRYNTVLYVTPVEGDIYDIHIQGSRDPYFGAERVHLLISELNKRGIKRIRKFSYDQNFKYLWFADDVESNKPIAVGFYTNSYPEPAVVEKQLKAYAKLTQGYEETFAKAKKLGISMVEKPDFSVETIEHLPAADFKMALGAKMYSVASRTMTTILKEMNRNSNNYAANQIFEDLGSSSEFQKFIKESLGLDNKAVVMLNGSGDRVDTAYGAAYNSASCDAMIKIISDLHKSLINQKSSFKQIMTVVGTDPGTATDYYTNDTTFDAVVAKTGTVRTAVTLAGAANTQKGLIYFMINVDPNGAYAKARDIIRKELVELVNKFGGPSRIGGQGVTFFSFDSKSFSDLEVQGALL